MSINALFHPASTADIPPPAPRSQPEETARESVPALELSIGLTSAKAIRAGTKTTVIVPLYRFPEATRLAIDDGFTFDVQARARRHRRRIDVVVTGVCPHDFLGDVPACVGEHQASAINPKNPTWAHCLGFAANSGSSPLSPRDRNRLASRGWLVVDFAMTGRR